MKSGILILIIGFTLSLSPGLIQAQIPNAGFETWVPLGLYENPQGWQTSNEAQEDEASIFKDTSAYAGAFSIRVRPDCPSFEFYHCPGWARTSLGLSGNIPAVLQAHTKCPTGDIVSGHCEIEVNLWQGDSIVSSNLWKDSTFCITLDCLDTLSWQLTSLAVNPLQLNSADSLEIILRSVPNTGPTGGGLAIFHVDDLTFGQATDLKMPPAPPWRVFPNPAQHLLRLEPTSPMPQAPLLRDLLGQAIPLPATRQGRVWQWDVRALPPGVYLLQGYHQGQRYSQKWVKR